MVICVKVKFYVPAWLEIYLDVDKDVRLSETRIYIDANDWDDWFAENAEVLEGEWVDKRKLWELVMDTVRKISIRTIRESLKEIGWA